MTVELTSPVLGKGVGDTYTGDLEGWLLANGYAKQDGYTGPGVSNTGAVDVAPDSDPTNPANREDPLWPETDEVNWSIANDATNLTKTSFPNPQYDFDQAGVNDDAPVVEGVEPTDGAAAGGDTVTVSGSGFEGATSVTFGGVEAASFEVVSDSEISAVTPAGTAGAADVVVTNATGADTLTGGFTFA